MALVGPSGSGKTFSALSIATGLGERIALVDTERASASKYADEFSFDCMELESFHPQRFIDAIHEAEKGGYEVLIIDSLSHAWMGKDGALEQVDNAAKRSKSSNSFAAWREVTPLHNALVDAILRSRLHIIATMRVKTEWVLEKDKDGRTVPKKVGLAPVQRDSVEYEFDVVGDLDEATLVITKTRCRALHEGVFKRPGADLGKTLRAWLTDGALAPWQRLLLAGVELGRTEKDIGGLVRTVTGKTTTGALTDEDVANVLSRLKEPDASAATT
jgi:KaiC/GvpD/RAD55 family RecA-like ATPase